MAALHMRMAEIGVQGGDGIVAPAAHITLPLPKVLGRRRGGGLGGLDGNGACGHGRTRHDSVQVIVPHAERTAG
jgi:hypothetical protein